MNKIAKQVLGGALAALAAAALGPARADHAVVVGVCHYPALPDTDQLDGPDNDAQSIADKLTQAGFTVTTLKDETATKQGILDALKTMQAQNGAGERFVFYFAGHGTKTPDGGGAILASDASPQSQSNFITTQELYQAVSAVPARGRTVLLDSCFSGAMARSYSARKGLRPHLKSRYVNFFAMPKKLVLTDEVNNNDVPTPTPAGGGAVCYFAAASPYQQAYEDQIDGHDAGIFTHYLVTRLGASQEPWSGIQTDVSGNVMTNTQGIQTPVLSQGYASVNVFDGLGGAPAPAPTPGPAPPPTPTPPAPSQAKTVWDAFSEDNRDPGKIGLQMTPNRSTVKVGEKFKFQATPGIDGYLVVMEWDTDGALNLVYPASRNIADAQVKAGSVISLPAQTGKAYTADKEGSERLKAVLFTSQDAAQQLLSGFPDSGTLSSSNKARGRKLQVVDEGPAHSFYTSALGFEVSTAGATP